MMKKVVACVMSSMVGLSGCQTLSSGKKIAKADFTYSDKQHCESPIHMKVGQVFRFDAAENASTGYYWSLIKSNDALFRVEQRYVSDHTAPNMVGVGGTKSFIFTSLKAGETDIILHHGRGWGSYDGTPWQCKLQIVDAI